MIIFPRQSSSRMLTSQQRPARRLTPSPLADGVTVFVMSPQILLSRSLAVASALAAVFIAPSGVTLALAADTAPTVPQSKLDANMPQLQITDTMVGNGAEAVKGKERAVDDRRQITPQFVMTKPMDDPRHTASKFCAG